MLERVMRRFGVAGQPHGRKPTFFEELLNETKPRVQELLKNNPTGKPLTLVARAIVQTVKVAASGAEPPSEKLDEAALAYLSILCDNDILPPPCQLTRQEMGLTWNLLMDSSTSQGEDTQSFEAVLSLLEDKFQGGKYPQASLLLRLFETTETRRRNNERTLFYEEMIARFGAHRPDPISRNLVKRYHQKVEAVSEPVERILAAAEWLSEHAKVNLNAPVRQADDIAAWEAIFEGVADPEDRAVALTLLPPSRLRNVVEIGDGDLADSFAAQLDTDSLVNYTSQLLKCCYFIVLVTGKTGFEPFIRSFFNWMEQSLSFPGCRLLPDLHRRTTVGEESLEHTVTDLCRSRLSHSLATLLKRLDRPCIDRALSSLADEFLTLDPSQIPPGEYTLFGFLMDKVTYFPSGDPAALYRIHRLC